MAKITIGRKLTSAVDSVTAIQGSPPWSVQDLNKLVPEQYDHIDLSYTGDDITGAVFKSGGAGGTVVATLTLGYSGGKLTTVTRT